MVFLSCVEFMLACKVLWSDPLAPGSNGLEVCVVVKEDGVCMACSGHC